MTFEKLKNLRRAEGYTQQQMAYLLGLSSRNAYSMKEQGKRHFTLEEGMMVARFLGYPAEKLFYEPSVTNMVTENDA